VVVSPRCVVVESYSDSPCITTTPEGVRTSIRRSVPVTQKVRLISSSVKHRSVVIVSRPSVAAAWAGNALAPKSAVTPTPTAASRFKFPIMNFILFRWCPCLPMGMAGAYFG
jgi:hypothetical protein